MSIGHLCLCLCCLMALSTCQKLVNWLCQGSLCMYLYEASDIYKTWPESKDICTSLGQKLLKIESSERQTLVERLLQNVTNGEIWTGGRMDANNNAWLYMNGTRFDEEVPNTNTGFYCSSVTLCKNSTSKYLERPCNNETVATHLLCQFDKTTTDTRFGDQGYAKIEYSSSESNTLDWYSAQTYCGQSSVQGDIAYSYLDNNDLIDTIKTCLNQTTDCVTLWLGVRKKRWLWYTESEPIRFFNWDNDADTENRDHGCVVLNPSKSNKWFTKTCFTLLKYFICMNDISTTAASTTVTTTITSGSSTTICNMPGDNLLTTETQQVVTSGITDESESSSDSNPSSNNLIVISLAVALVVLLIVIAGVLIFHFCFRKKRGKKRRTRQGVRDNVGNVLFNQRATPDPQYADVTPVDDDEVFNTSNKPSDASATVSRNVQRPNRNVEQDGAPQENPYEIPERLVNGNPQEDEKAKARGQEGANEKVSQKYKEVPSGDLYAMAVKNIKKKVD